MAVLAAACGSTPGEPSGDATTGGSGDGSTPPGTGDNPSGSSGAVDTTTSTTTATGPTTDPSGTDSTSSGSESTETGPGVDGPLPAFPGAEGFGAVAEGGRGGAVLYVDTLDDGPQEGTLRWALTQEFPRTIVFSVAGIIELGGPIVIEGEEKSYLTVAGQTAPGSGITLRGGYLQFETVHDVVIRYLRIRPGVNNDVWERDALTGFGVQRFIVDHVSAGWASDEAISVNAAESYGHADAVTIQRSLMTENDPLHNTGSLLSTGTPTEDFPGGMPEHGFSSHHNAFVHISHRFPNARGAGRFEAINNVVHNWNSRLVAVSLAAEVDHINNYYQVGPMHEADIDLTPWLCKIRIEDGLFAQIYTVGNVVVPDFHTDPDADNWHFWEGYTTSFSQHLAVDEDDYRKGAANPAKTHPVTVLSAEEAFVSVSADVGANARLDENGAWVENLDAVDRRYLDDLIDRTGPPAYANPDSHAYPAQDPGTAYADGDEDGMADTWEAAQGLDPLDPSDRNGLELSRRGYTNLEVFLAGGE